MFQLIFIELFISGSVSGGLYGANMNGISTGVKGPFTPSQWMELEHQALIYKYITANYPVPSNLLNPIKKALESARFSSFSGANMKSCKFAFWSLINSSLFFICSSYIHTLCWISNVSLFFFLFFFVMT